MKKNILHIMIGIPGSGKSNFAKEKLLDDNTVYLSSDEFRIKMFGFEDQTHNSEIFSRMKKEASLYLDNGKNVIYDATNLSAKKRKDIINLAKKKGVLINAYLMCTPINTILERNIVRGERFIPWEKMIQMIRGIEPPMYYEGFDNIFLINGGFKEDYYNYNKLIKDCKNYKQGNPYHNETLEEHIDACWNNAIKLSKKCNFRTNFDILIQAAKYHDFGKLYSKQYNDKKGYFVYYGHEKVSTYIYLCHSLFDGNIFNKKWVRLNNKKYQVSALILNHMEWYRRKNMLPIKNKFKDDNLYELLSILHDADSLSKKENI